MLFRCLCKLYEIHFVSGIVTLTYVSVSKTCICVVLQCVVIGGVFTVPEERERESLYSVSVCLTTCITDNIYAVENGVCFS